MNKLLANVAVLTLCLFLNKTPLRAQYVRITSDSLILYGSGIAARQICDQFIREFYKPEILKYFKKYRPHLNMPFLWTQKKKYIKMYMSLRENSLLLDSISIDCGRDSLLNQDLRFASDYIIKQMPVAGSGRLAVFANVDLHFDYGDSTWVGVSPRGIDISQQLYLFSYSRSISLVNGKVTKLVTYRNTTSGKVHGYRPPGYVIFDTLTAAQNASIHQASCHKSRYDYNFSFNLKLGEFGILGSRSTIDDPKDCLELVKTYLQGLVMLPRVEYRGGLVLDSGNASFTFLQAKSGRRVPAFYLRYDKPGFYVKNIEARQKGA